MLDLLITHANLPDGRTDIDIAIRDGRIVEVAPHIAAQAQTVINAAGQLVTPPFVDAHFHMDALIEIKAFAFIDALRDVGRLLVVGHHHAAALVIKADIGIGITDALDGFARHLCVIDARTGGDLAGEYDKAGVCQRFGGNAAIFVLRENGIKHGIGNGIRNFIGMAFGNGFGGKQEITHGMGLIGLVDLASL